MRKMLEELYHGNINPTVKQFNRGTRYDEALRMMCKNEDKLEAMLAGGQGERKRRFLRCKGQPISLSCIRTNTGGDLHFAYGS